MASQMRFQFCKDDELRFLSHLDLLRTLDRAVRRSKITLELSQGFRPKPKMNFASALAVGVTSQAEYGDFILAEELSPKEFITRLNQALPLGLRIIRAGIVENKGPALMSQVDTAEYQIQVDLSASDGLQATINNLLAQPSVLVERTTKKGVRQVDLKPLIFSLSLDKQDSAVDIILRCASGNAGNLRPEDLLKVLEIPANSARINRTGLFIRDGKEYRDPLTGIEVEYA